MKQTFISLLLASAVTCSAAVTQSDASIGPSFLGPDSDFFSVSNTSIGLFISSSLPRQFTFEYGYLAMAYSLFQVSLGQSFNADFVNSQASFVNNFNNPGAGTFVLLSGQSKYLAYWSQKNGPPDRIAVDSDFYGWARFTNISGTLVVADSATADSGGIIVGTLEQVPEPSSALLFGLGSLCLFSRRRGK